MRMLILWFTFACVALADEPKARVNGIKVLEQGIYKCEVVKRIKDPRVPAGQRALLGPATLVQETSRIPDILGTRFGFRFKIDGLPIGQKINLVIVGIYPGDGLHDPAKPTTLKTFEYTHPYIVGGVGYMDYSFDHVWELVPGEWTFQLWYDGTKQTEVKFGVVNPDSK